VWNYEAGFKLGKFSLVDNPHLPDGRPTCLATYLLGSSVRLDRCRFWCRLSSSVVRACASGIHQRPTSAIETGVFQPAHESHAQQCLSTVSKTSFQPVFADQHFQARLSKFVSLTRWPQEEIMSYKLHSTRDIPESIYPIAWPVNSRNLCAMALNKLNG
jgi:hypothetical protein